MKFAPILVLCSALILASTMHSSEAWPNKEIFKKEADTETSRDYRAEQTADRPPVLCNDYFESNYALKECINVTLPWIVIPNSYFILDGLTHMCRDRDEIRECMLNKIERCETNYDTLMGMLNTTFEYCDGYEIPNDVKNFLESENVTVNRACANAVFDFECNRSALPRCFPNRGTFVGMFNSTYTTWSWHVDCWLSNVQNGLAGDQCGNVTRGQAIGIRISTLPLFFCLGVNHYPSFEAFKLEYGIANF